jgi:hypothetical protein
MLTVIGFLVGAAFLVTIVAAIGKAPLWVAVLLLVLVELLRLLPLGPIPR